MDERTRKQHEREIYDLVANLDRPAYNSYWDAELYARMFAYEFSRDLDRLGRVYLSSRNVLVIGATVANILAVGQFTDRITAINISEREIAPIREKYPKIETIIGDVESLEIDQRFDAIYCKSVLHHLHPIDQVIGRLQYCLGPGGILFIACEPGLLNPLAAAARAWMPSQSHTPGERPFVFSAFDRLLRARFASVEVKYYFLCSMIWPFLARRLPSARPLWRALLSANLLAEQGLRKLRIFNNLFWIMTGVYKSKQG
jgi:SAM-dependent methyltransferase